MKLLLVALGLSLCGAAQAQTLYKCKNAAGKITYAERECKELGLLSAGEVKGEVNVVPGPSVPEEGRRSSRSAQPKADAGPVAAPEEEPKPVRRCFTVKNAKGGTSTRCNDSPDEPEKPEGSQ